MADGKRLQRLHRVRTLQLNLARADEARAREQVTSEQQLSHRIAQLAAAVAPHRCTSRSNRAGPYPLYRYYRASRARSR